MKITSFKNYRLDYKLWVNEGIVTIIVCKNELLLSVCLDSESHRKSYGNYDYEDIIPTTVIIGVWLQRFIKSDFIEG